MLSNKILTRAKGINSSINHKGIHHHNRSKLSLISIDTTTQKYIPLPPQGTVTKILDSFITQKLKFF